MAASAADRAEGPLQDTPVNRPRQPDQGMVEGNDLVEPRPEQITLTALHRFRRRWEGAATAARAYPEAGLPDLKVACLNAAQRLRSILPADA